MLAPRHPLHSDSSDPDGEGEASNMASERDPITVAPTPAPVAACPTDIFMTCSSIVRDKVELETPD